VTKQALTEFKKVQEDLGKLSDTLKPIHKQMNQKTKQMDARIKNSLKGANAQQLNL
jgi:hypothetical protein